MHCRLRRCMFFCATLVDCGVECVPTAAFRRLKPHYAEGVSLQSPGSLVLRRTLGYRSHSQRVTLKALNILGTDAIVNPTHTVHQSRRRISCTIGETHLGMFRDDDVLPDSQCIR